MCISITWEHYNLKQVFPSKIIHKSLYKLQHYKSSEGLSIKTADIRNMIAHSVREYYLLGSHSQITQLLTELYTL